MQSTLERLRQRREERGDEGGFTLIELLIVIVILGILAAIVVFAVQNLSSTSAQSACKSDFKTVETGVEAYKAQMGNYPSGSGTAPSATGTGATGPTPNTDSDIGTAVQFTAAAAPTYKAGGTGTPVNAAGSASTTASGDELLVAGNAGKNTSGTASIGPWLKDVPANSGHYTIFVANDGSGAVQVLNSTGNVVGATQTAADCSAI